MEFHEVANIFPLMGNEEIDDLAVDIQREGLHHPIVLHEGKILDGRNRYIACLKVGIEPQYEEWNNGGSPIAYVVSENLKRRHLTSGQKAFASLEAERLAAERAKERQEASRFGTVVENFPPPEPGKAREEAASLFDVNPHYVTDAKAINEKAPDIADRVKSGEWTMNRAKTEYKRREKRAKVRKYTEQIAQSPPIQKRYNVIYADPPWEYSENTNTLDAVTDRHYATLSIDKVETYLQDHHISTQDDSVLFLWVTNPFLEKALQVVKAWGFEYKTNIVWVKRDLKKPGVGYYVRGRHELLFICTRGSFTPLDKNISPPIGSVLEASIGEHSEKPHDVYAIIERLYPDCVYLELFARDKREGWDRLGDEA